MQLGLVAGVLIRLPVQPEANLTADDVVGVAARERYKLNNFRVAIEDAVVPRQRRNGEMRFWQKWRPGMVPKAYGKVNMASRYHSKSIYVLNQWMV